MFTFTSTKKVVYLTWDEYMQLLAEKHSLGAACTVQSISYPRDDGDILVIFKNEPSVEYVVSSSRS